MRPSPGDPIATQPSSFWLSPTPWVACFFAVQVAAALFFLEITETLFWYLLPLAIGYLAIWVALMARVLISRGLGRGARVGNVALLLASGALAYCSPDIGTYSKLWRHEDAYLEQIRIALGRPQPGDRPNPSIPVTVDPSDAPVVVATICWFAAHGDWAGIAYHPSGAVGARAESVATSHGTMELRFRHLWGPWSFCSN